MGSLRGLGRGQGGGRGRLNRFGFVFGVIQVERNDWDDSGLGGFGAGFVEFVDNEAVAFLSKPEVSGERVEVNFFLSGNVGME